MTKSGLYYTTVLLLVIFISSGFKKESKMPPLADFHTNNKALLFVFPTTDLHEYAAYQVPFTGHFFVGFKNAVAFRESQGKYKKINPWGFLGKYQFGPNTLKKVGIHNTSRFLQSPRLQEEAFVALLAQNKDALAKYISYFEGKVVAGVKITESGILAAAHLGGVSSVKRFLNSNGKWRCRDHNGASVRSYMREFGGYDTANIPADEKAKVNL
ncbi:MAG: peptidoglycan-binding protein LysM [Flavobacterium sp. BFFFF2]|nr:MAG: peptidoglycan-binding protein LysM [Flavobacterium sp. BFFFF2]